MPYSISTKDGITINNIPDDVAPDSPELKARVASIRSGQAEAQPAAAQPAPARSTYFDVSQLGEIAPRRQYGRKNAQVTPIEQRPPTKLGQEYNQFISAQLEQDIRAQTDPVIRYAPSAVAAMATGGASIPIQMATMGGTQFAGSLASGQDVKTAAQDALIASTPIFRFGNISAGKTALDMFGTGLARAGATGATAVTLSEIGRAIQEGGYTPPKDFREAAQRLAGPTLAFGFSALGSAGEMFSATGKSASSIRATRAVGGIQDTAGKSVGGASLALTDVFPGYAGLEARQLAQGNPRAIAALRDMTKPVNEAIVDAFSDVPNINEVLRPVLPDIGKLEKLRIAAVQAQDKAASARAAADAALASGSPEVSRLAKEAADAGFAAANAKVVHEMGIDALARGNRPTLFQLSPEENASRLAEITNAAVSKQKEAVNSLYDAAGIDINAPVIDRETAIKAINQASRQKGNLLRGADARNAAIEQLNKAFGDDTVMSLERYRRVRDGIANGLSENPILSKSANKIASDTYNALRSASDEFVKKNYAQQYDAWVMANKAVANFSDAINNDFLAPFLDAAGGGKLKSATQLVTALEKGEVTGFDALTKMADSIAETGRIAGDQNAILAANEFRKGVVRTIANGVLNKNTLNRAVGAGAEAAAVIDANGLYSSLSKLESNGFPIEALGFGNKKDVLALAKLSQSRSVTRAELENFVSIVGTIGGDRAAARINYQRAVKDEMLARGVADKQRAIQAKTAAARKAGIDAAQAQEIAKKAAEDPVVRLFNETGTFGITADETINQSGFIQNLMSLPPRTVGKLISALEEGGRLGVRDGIRKNAALDVIGSFGDYVKGETPEVALQKINNFFYSPDPVLRNQRETLRAILGPDQYRNIQQIAPNIASALQTQARIVGAQGLQMPGKEVIRGIVSAGGLASGKLTSGAVAGASAGFFQRLLERQQYNTLYTLFVDPRWAPKFAKIGYNVEKLVKESPVALVAYQDAVRRDNASQQQAQQSQPTP